MATDSVNQYRMRDIGDTHWSVWLDMKGFNPDEGGEYQFRLKPLVPPHTIMNDNMGWAFHCPEWGDGETSAYGTTAQQCANALVGHLEHAHASAFADTPNMPERAIPPHKVHHFGGRWTWECPDPQYDQSSPLFSKPEDICKSLAGHIDRCH